MEKLNKTTMKNLFLLVLLLTISISGIYCQSDKKLWIDLELELFPKEQEKQLLYKLIECPENKIDSSIWVRTNQPDVEKVFSILSEIMHKKDTGDFDRLKTIYERHIQNFMQEWSRAYLENQYACKPISEQYSLLSGFETVLTSLFFHQEGFSSKDIFDFYISRMKLYDNVSIKTSRSEWLRINQQYLMFSSTYRQLNPSYVRRGRVPFYYIDPYLEELEPYFVSYLEEACDWNDKSKESDCMVIWSSSRFYSKMMNDRILEDFISNFDEWKDNYRHTYIYSYAGKFFKPELSHFLVEKWIEEKDSILNKSQYKPIPILFLLRHEANIAIVLNHLVEYASHDFEHAIELFIYIRVYKYTEYLNEIQPANLVRRLKKRLNLPKN